MARAYRKKSNVEPQPAASIAPVGSLILICRGAAPGLVKKLLAQVAQYNEIQEGDAPISNSGLTVVEVDTSGGLASLIESGQKAGLRVGIVVSDGRHNPPVADIALKLKRFATTTLRQSGAEVFDLVEVIAQPARNRLLAWLASSNERFVVDATKFAQVLREKDILVGQILSRPS